MPLSQLTHWGRQTAIDATGDSSLAQSHGHQHWGPGAAPTDFCVEANTDDDTTGLASSDVGSLERGSV